MILGQCVVILIALGLVGLLCWFVMGSINDEFELREMQREWMDLRVHFHEKELRRKKSRNKNKVNFKPLKK